MTVTEFGIKDLKVNSSIALLIALVVVSSMFGVLLYKNLITLRHDVTTNKERIEHLQVTNAELQNNLYLITDNVLQESLLQESGLVLDKSPSYVQIPTVSHLSY